MRDWRRERAGTALRTLPLALGTVLLADWALFLHFLIQSQTAYGEYYRTSWRTAILLLLPFLALIASIVAPVGKWKLLVGSMLIVTLWVCVAYAPAHWLTRVDFARVTIDNYPVPASVYLGHPTDSESDAIALVRLKDEGDYFLDFGSEKVRQASRSDYVRFVGGAWCFRSMQYGRFVEPLPFRKMNEFRVLSRAGHLIAVQF